MSHSHGIASTSANFSLDSDIPFFFCMHCTELSCTRPIWSEEDANIQHQSVILLLLTFLCRNVYNHIPNRAKSSCYNNRGLQDLVGNEEELVGDRETRWWSVGLYGAWVVSSFVAGNCTFSMHFMAMLFDYVNQASAALCTLASPEDRGTERRW